MVMGPAMECVEVELAVSGDKHKAEHTHGQGTSDCISNLVTWASMAAAVVGGIMNSRVEVLVEIGNLTICWVMANSANTLHCTGR
jgi:hypothetical protein